MKLSRFAKYAWAVVAINLVVIVWGGFVRATGSGAGCGSHWPLCNGQVIPRAPTTEMLIEFSHRISSGIALLSVVVLLIWAYRAYARGHAVRRGAAVAMALMVVEALIGAGLVLLEYVAYNVSVARAWWMAGHLLNTFLLMAALSLTAWWASGGQPLRLRGQGAGQRTTVWLLGGALAGLLVLGMSGAVTALGDTLVLGGGISPDESPIVAGLVGMRIYHPLIAFVVGALVAAAAWIVHARRPGVAARRIAVFILAVYALQLLLGALNVALKAPVWIQMLHLLLSNLIWVGVVLLAAAALGSEVQEGTTAPAARPVAPAGGAAPRVS